MNVQGILGLFKIILSSFEKNNSRNGKIWYNYCKFSIGFDQFKVSLELMMIGSCMG